MFRRTVIAEGYNSQVLFDIADNAAGTNWYRMGANHQIVNNNASVQTYKIRFKPSGGFPGADITPTLVPYFYYKIVGEPETPANWNEMVTLLSNPENYTTVRTVCTKNDDGYWYGTLNLEAGVSYVFPCGNYLAANLKENYTFNFTGEHCTGTFEYRNAGGQPRTDFNSGDKIPLAYQLILTLTADEGYSFTGEESLTFDTPYYSAPAISNQGTKMTATYTVVWAGDVVPITAVDQWPTSATLNVSATATIAQDGNFIEVESSENCVVNGVPESGFVTTGTSVTLLAIANEGYYFNGRPYIRYTGTDGTEHNLFMTRLSNDTRATVTQVFSQIAQNLTTAYIVCNAVAIPLQENNVTVQTQVNCTVSAPTTYTENDTFSATATPNEGYRFDTAPTVTYGETVLNFTVDSETGVASFNQVLQNVPEGATILVNATANLIPAKTYPIVQNLTNCTVQGVPESGVYTEGETLSLTLTANSGYYFDVPPRLYFEGNGGQTGYFDFTINPNNDTIATLSKTLSNLKDDSDITISANAVPQTTYTDKYGSINVYNVTVANLQQFAEERFITVGTDEVAEIDLGEYVSKLFRLYCDIGNTTESTLKVANYDLTNINVQVPVNDIVTVDCGTITVTGKNGTANDFNGELQIFLPFIGLQSLNIDKALNNPLHLYYKINIVTGEAVAILEIDEIPSEFWDCKACQEILYLSHTQETFSDYEFKSKFLYGYTPFIIYKYNTDFNNSPVNSDSVRMKVNECEGYFEMTETTPFNAQNMNETERARIIELLASGVFYGAEFPNT